MNSIRQIQELNKRELEAGVSPSASWHTDYRDTAYIYIGGLPFELSEGDIITIFSQFGEPTYINLIRDKETGKSKGFAFLKYEDQRSTDLAVDNLGGASVMGRILRVDHTRYKRKEGEKETGMEIGIVGKENGKNDVERRTRRTSGGGTEDESDKEVQRPMIKEERELARLIEEHDEDDPMKDFLIKEKREEVAQALARVKDGKNGEKEHKHKHRHRHRSSKREDDEEEAESRHSRHRRRERDAEQRLKDDEDRKYGNERSRRSRHEETFDDDNRRRQRSPGDGDRYHRSKYDEGRSERGDSTDRHRRTRKGS